MGKAYYVLEFEGPSYVETMYSMYEAIECLEHLREVTNDEWRLFKVWMKKGVEIRREEVMPYTS